MRFFDGLRNVVANLGTSRDKAAHSEYVDVILSAPQLLAAYRNSWLSRAIVNYPAEDATRKWRFWRAEADQITKIEAEEKRLNLQRRVQEAMIAARLYGGAAIYINTGDSQQDQPLEPGTDVKSLVVLTPNALSPDEIVRDIDSIYYGRPEFFALTAGPTARRVKIHASRLAIFRGAKVPDDMGLAGTHSRAWGDSVLQAAFDAIKQIDSAMANTASLVFEAKVDVFKFEGFADLLLAAGGDEQAINRLQTQAAMKGINGAVVIDAKDDYQQKSANFGGLPEVISKFMDNIAGASGIPVTRLYGRAAVGLSGSGDGDERVYYDRIGHQQATEIGPAISLLDDCIVTQALGSRPEEIYYEWAQLRQISETERADIFSKTATAARALAGANAGEIIPLDALSDSLVNEFTEQGMLPGLDQAVEKYGSLSEQSEFVGGGESLPMEGAYNEELRERFGGGVPFGQPVVADSDQPRVPSGNPRGGQWIKSPSSGQTSMGFFDADGGYIGQSQLITSQDYINEDIVQEKIEAGDFDVFVSPSFNAGEESVRVVLDGHHSLAAAIEAGVTPSFIEFDASDHDAVAFIERGDIDAFLEAVHMGSDYMNAVTHKGVW